MAKPVRAQGSEIAAQHPATGGAEAQFVSTGKLGDRPIELTICYVDYFGIERALRSSIFRNLDPANFRISSSCFILLSVTVRMCSPSDIGTGETDDVAAAAAN